MQKWIGVGKILDEPIEVEFGKLEGLLIWVDCKRPWGSGGDQVPVVFIGKRKKLLEQANMTAYAGSLVYVIGEISSRIKLNTKKVVNLGCCVFGTSIEFWDTEHIKNSNKNKIDNEVIIGSALDEL